MCVCVCTCVCMCVVYVVCGRYFVCSVALWVWCAVCGVWCVCVGGDRAQFSSQRLPALKPRPPTPHAYSTCDPQCPWEPPHNNSAHRACLQVHVSLATGHTNHLSTFRHKVQDLFHEKYSQVEGGGQRGGRKGWRVMIWMSGLRTWYIKHTSGECRQRGCHLFI